MHRVAANGGATLDDEHRTRLPPVSVQSPCPRPNVPAATLRAAVPRYPIAAAVSKASGTVLVLVLLDEGSRVLWTQIVRSDNRVFDEEAMTVARLSTFRTEVRGCRPLAARYVFSVDFTYFRI